MGMKFREDDCAIIRPLFDWLYPDGQSRTPEQFSAWWRSLSDERRYIEYMAAQLSPDCDF